MLLYAIIGYQSIILISISASRCDINNTTIHRHRIFFIYIQIVEYFVKLKSDVYVFFKSFFRKPSIMHLNRHAKMFLKPFQYVCNRTVHKGHPSAHPIRNEGP